MHNGAAIVLMIALALGLAGRPADGSSVQARRLDARIGRPNPDLYRSIRDAKDWENPYLVIHRDGIEGVVKRAVGRRTVAAADLERMLIELPITAWPYGRVVAVQEIGIRAGDGSDDKPVADNLRAALAILKELDVIADRWPTG